MPDPKVARWKQRGKVALWRYRDNVGNYSGFHMTADTTGCESLLELFRLMLEADYSSAQSIRLIPPTEGMLSVPNNRGGSARWRTSRVWTIRYPKSRVSPDHWELSVAERTCNLVTGRSLLEDLRKGVEDIQRGEGDYSIESGREQESNHPLWFWWWGGASCATLCEE
ncbi:MAG: hypothetical protein K0U98_10420 [Deltaproteobacteria bacterium]|nr:hypothetical protein [Deltaproteobacteria bacterium]